jgi:two-component system response regulator
MKASTILLIEDNPDDIELTRMALQENRIANELVIAQSGDAALEYLFGEGEDGEPCQPSLILLDLKLPRVNGVEVLRRIRACERMRFTPVIILTSSDEQRDLLESYSLGANSYVRKPIDYAEFVDAVRQLGIYWLLLNLAPPPQALTVAS